MEIKKIPLPCSRVPPCYPHCQMKDIFLPSACGGGGTCAMCECHIDAGGGDVLPTELNHLTRKEVAENMRIGLSG